MAVRPFVRFLLLVLCAASVPISARAQEQRPQLWNSTEIASPNLESFTNWTTVIGRFNQQAELAEGLCASASGGESGSTENCAWDKWQNILADAQGLEEVEQLRKINSLFNKRRYVLDQVNWGMEDYWQTVFEFLRKNGDCEDYALAKYVSLRALGWPASKLRLVILRDTKLNLNHAVLAAYTAQGIYIADNQVSGIVRADAIRHYRPIYSINENGWWLHRPARR